MLCREFSIKRKKKEKKVRNVWNIELLCFIFAVY